MASPYHTTGPPREWPRDRLPPPLASAWPPLSERNAAKRADVREAKASADAACGRVSAAIAAGDKAAEAAAKRDLSAAIASLARAKKALEHELARRERLRIAGLLDESGDARPAPGATALSALPFDAIREVFWRLPRDDVKNVVPLVCSDWARLPLDVRACCKSAIFGNSGSERGMWRIPSAIPDTVHLSIQLAELDGSVVCMTPEVLSAVLARSKARLETLTAVLLLGQLPMLAECLAARGPSYSSLRRLHLVLSCPAGAPSAAVTDARAEAVGASLAASSAPGLECVEVMTLSPWAHAAGYGPVRTLLLSLAAHSGGKLREIRCTGHVLTSPFVDLLEESFSIRKMDFKASSENPGLFLARFPKARGVSRTLRSLRFWVTILGGPHLNERVPGAREPTDVVCDVAGVSAEEALAPLAGAVTRLQFVQAGVRAALPQVLRLPGFFRALKSVRSLSVIYPWTSDEKMETSAAAAAAERAAATADIVFARALQPSSGRQRPAPQPWDLLSSLTELEVRFPLGVYFPLGNCELVLPPAGMPNLRRLDMRGTQPEMNVPEDMRDLGGVMASRRAYLPPLPAAVPSLLWLGIGFHHRREKDSIPLGAEDAYEELFPRALDLSALVPAGSSAQPYRHLRSLVIDNADLVVEGGRGGGKDEEVRRLLGAFPVVFPSLRTMHVHGCNVERTAERVLEGLADAYAAAANRAASAGARGAAAADDDDDGRSFRGVCRGCLAHDDSSITA